MDVPSSPHSEPPLIALRSVRKKFGPRLVLDEVALEVPRGEIYGLLGHNGAGKSTAIGMMLGQVWPDAGEVRLFGYDVFSQRRQALQKVGAIFETPAFYDYLSGWRNLQLLSHYTAPTPPARLAEVLDWVGLSGREHAKVRTYSHGMRTRLALAQALLPQPELLILDEPGNGLDPAGIHEMRQTIRRLHRELGLTILLSSHLLAEVEQVCTRIAVLKDGRKVFDGTLAEATRQAQWLRLRTDDFPAAVRLLRQAGLITGHREDCCVALAAHAGPDQVVRRLVQAGLAVFEIAPDERTLEDFYLELMRQANGPGALAAGPEFLAGAPNRAS